jgi:hypothetical protein
MDKWMDECCNGITLSIQLKRLVIYFASDWSTHERDGRIRKRTDMCGCVQATIASSQPRFADFICDRLIADCIITYIL